MRRSCAIVTARYYPELNPDLIRVVLVHPGSFLLPELGEELGWYAELKLRERGVEVIKGTRVSSYDGATVRLSDGSAVEQPRSSGRPASNQTE